MPSTNVLAIVLLAIAVLVILVLRKRGEQRMGSAGTSPAMPPPLGGATASSGDRTHVDTHAHVESAVHASANVMSRLPAEDKAVLDRWLGGDGGEWTVEQKARFAAGIQRFIWDGQDLPAMLTLVSKMLHMKYPVVPGTPLDIEVPPNVRAVFAKLMHGSISISTG